MAPTSQIAPPAPSLDPPLAEAHASRSGAFVPPTSPRPPAASPSLDLDADRASQGAAVATLPDYGSDLDSDDASAAAALLDEAESSRSASAAGLAAAGVVRPALPVADGPYYAHAHANAAPPATAAASAAGRRRGRVVRRDGGRPPSEELVARECYTPLYLGRVLTD
jgi:hypothetical protein